MPLTPRDEARKMVWWGMTVVLARARLGDVAIGDGFPVVLMGVLNVSPESFYAGSVHVGEDDLLRAADEMIGAGARILDVGAMSTAPYLETRIDEAEEADRLAGAVARLTEKFSVAVSADTTRSGPARAALDAGATIINDVSGLRGDPAMASLLAARGAGAVLMASRSGTERRREYRRGGRPAGAQARAPVRTVASLLGDSLDRARRAGIAEERIVLDPGIGFFRDEAIRWFEWDAAVLAHLSDLRRFGRPLAVGVSRKSFIGALTAEADPAHRLAGSLAATAVAVRNGAALVRTHDVAPTRDAVLVASALRQSPRPGGPRSPSDRRQSPRPGGPRSPSDRRQ
jgi:dihydropteroate synthase